MTSSTIDHSGIISHIDHETIKVKIISASACSACHAKGACLASDMEEKIIDIQNNFSNSLKIGDNVNVEMNNSSGIIAVLLGYLFPFVVMLTTFIILINIINDQNLAGLLSLASLIPYYIVLSLFKKKHQENFEFRIKTLG